MKPKPMTIKEFQAEIAKLGDPDGELWVRSFDQREFVVVDVIPDEDQNGKPYLLIFIVPAAETNPLPPTLLS